MAKRVFKSLYSFLRERFKYFSGFRFSDLKTMEEGVPVTVV